MDTEKWRSVVIPISTYEIIKEEAKKNHRGISRQVTYMIEKELLKEKVA